MRISDSHHTWERFLQEDLCQLISQYKADLLDPGTSEGPTLPLHFLSRSVEGDPYNKMKTPHWVSTFFVPTSRFYTHLCFQMTSNKCVCVCTYILIATEKNTPSTLEECGLSLYLNKVKQEVLMTVSCIRPYTSKKHTMWNIPPMVQTLQKPYLNYVTQCS